MWHHIHCMLIGAMAAVLWNPSHCIPPPPSRYCIWSMFLSKYLSLNIPPPGYLGGYWGTQFKPGAECALRSLTSLPSHKKCCSIYSSTVIVCKRLMTCWDLCQKVGQGLSCDFSPKLYQSMKLLYNEASTAYSTMGFTADVHKTCCTDLLFFFVGKKGGVNVMVQLISSPCLHVKLLQSQLVC